MTATAAGTEYFGGRARLLACDRHADARGVLVPFHFDALPFVPCRAFVVGDVPAGTVRGGHAHRSATQILVCLQGRIEVLLRVGNEEVALTLEPLRFGLVVGPGVWCRQRYLADGSVLLVFASEPYDPASYVDG
jgi:dTDP-4-dehydrorhamnose 3,5-epimerase-like enzyme